MTSFTHAGQYYTLNDVPKFDELGLWFFKDVGFSRYGTLKQTVAMLVNEACMGYSHSELLRVLRVRVHNTLLHLVDSKSIGRTQFGRVHLYVSSTPDRAAQQIERRREIENTITEAQRIPSNQEVVEVLIETLRAAPELPKPDIVARRLAKRGIRIELRHIKKIFEDHGLVPEKKTVQNSSLPYRH
jgi:hypothetical protein